MAGMRRGGAGLSLVTVLMAGTAVAGLAPATVWAQPALSASPARMVDIPAQDLASALIAFSRQTRVEILVDSAIARGKRSTAVSGSLTSEQALQRLLAGTGLGYRFTGTDAVTVIAPSPAGDAGGAVVLDTITVAGAGESAYGAAQGYRATRSATATKTDTPLRDVPQSVQVVTRDTIADRQALTLTEAVETVSNTRQNSTAGNRGETFLIRGISQPRYAVDGVMLNPLLDRGETFLDLANVERVEVLKGPASVLYGQAQPGGLINVVTRRPTDRFIADGAVQGGSRGYWRGEGSVSGPLDAEKTLTARVTGAAQQEDGFRDGAHESERQLGALALQWRPGADTTLRADVEHTHQLVPYDRGLPVTTDNEVSLPRDRYLGEDWSKVDARKTRLALSAEHWTSRWLMLRAGARYDIARVEDTGIDFRDLQSDGRTLRRRYNDRVEDSRNFDLQFEGVATFRTGDIGHTVLAGAQYAHSRMDFLGYRGNIASIDIFDPVYGAPMTETSLNSDYLAQADLYSVYAQDQIDLSPRWKLLAGLRYDRLKQTEDQRVGGSPPDVKEGALTTRFGIVYQPVEPVSLYTSYSESFIPQGGIAQDGGSLAPQEGYQIEAGVKVDLIPDRLSATASVFQIVKSNVATADPANPDADYSLLTGKQRVRGAELDVSGVVAPGWELIASVGYLDAQVTEDETFEVGNRLTGVPKLSGSLWVLHEVQDGALAGLKLGAGVVAVGPRKGDLDNSFDVDGYVRFDATASYAINDKVELTLVGKNLTDKDYIAAPVSRTENHPGAPPTVIAGIKARL